MTNATINMATDKQIDYLRSLCNDRDVDNAFDVAKLDEAIEAGQLSKDLASTFIGMALKCARRFAAQVQRVELEDGMYRMDGVIYKVQHAVHGSGRQYAKRLCQDTAMSPEYNARYAIDRAWRFEYVAGAVLRLTAAMHMSLDEAKEFGTLYGTCCVCGRTLTDEVSIADGIGPVCAKKFF